MTSKNTIFTDRDSTIRDDLIRAALLVVLTVLLWCTIYDRWTVESWQTPLTYLSDPMKGDVFADLASIEAARDGHISPFFFNNVPELGAPSIANWDDFPLTEKPLIILTGVLARGVGIFAAANFAVLFGQVLAALSFYAACRMLGCAWIWCFAGAFVFAFSRYAFAHGLHHITIAYDWHVPLCLVVCGWLIRGDGIKLGEDRFKSALLIAFVTGAQNVYYTFMFAQLILLGGLYQGWRQGWRQSLPAAAIIGSSAAAFALMNLNSIIYSLVNGGNDGAMARDYQWLEIYGLKLVDLVIPPPDHAFPPFAAWGSAHLKEIVLSAGEVPPTAYLGLLGIAALTSLVIVSWLRTVSRSVPPLEALLVLWIILYASVGGLNSVLGSLGFLMFRSTTRYSIFILCIVLMYAVRQLSLVKFSHNLLCYGLAVLAILIAWWDQTPPRVTDRELTETAAQVASDQHFTEEMEKRLPPGAMIFQLPVMDFPESPVPGVTSYEHLRPYLYSHTLRFSFGSDKGRPAAEWQHELAQLPLGGRLSALENKGFKAIFVNRNGFSDKGAELLKKLKAIGIADTLESERGDLVCVILKGQ